MRSQYSEAMKMDREIFENLGLTNELLFESLLSQTSDMIYFKDTKSRFVLISDSMVRNFRAKSPDDIIGKSDFDFFSIEHAQQAFDDEQRVIATCSPIVREAEKETWPDGSVTWASSIKTPITLENGEVIGLLGISRDVTEMKRAQDALEQRDRILRDQNNTMLADLENAHIVQSQLIPGNIRHSAIVRIAISYEPSHSVSGDVVTFPRPDEPGVRFFLGDVCGHGVSAGLYTLLVKYAADRQSRAKDDRPQSILHRLNESLLEVLPNRFVTAVTGVFEKEGEDQVRLTVSHAAHPTFFIHRVSDELETIQLDIAAGLGLLSGSQYEDREFILQRGDRIIFYTDGLEEALNENGEEFGIERLQQTIRESRNERFHTVPQFLLDKIHAYSGKAPRVDDQTCIVIEAR